MTAVDLALKAIEVALKLYAAVGGPPVDLVKLAKDCDVEIERIDAQQAKDEAAENAAAKKVD